MTERPQVLVIDDEPLVRRSTQRLLSAEDYEVLTAATAAEGLATFETARPQLVILDIKMPGMDGLEVARCISDERLSAVLILTAFSQRDLIEQARDAGVLAYLVKPFQRSELVPAIELSLGRFQEMEALHAHAETLEDRLETRKLVDRAKGKLMDGHGMAEQDAFRFIQTTAMQDRASMKVVAEQIVAGVRTPEG